MGDLMNEFSEMMNDRISIYDEAGKLVAENELALVDGGKSIITDRGNFIVVMCAEKTGGFNLVN